MGIRYEDLDATVRRAMASELERDIAVGTLYVSPRLTEGGATMWTALLRAAIDSHDDDWLAGQLRDRGLVRDFEQRRKPSGGFTQVNVPESAAETLAEGEFNRYYARGLCVAVLDQGGFEVEIYRGKAVLSPRPESEGRIGHRVTAAVLLTNLRSSQGFEPALGLRYGPNSGLTVRRPR